MITDMGNQQHGDQWRQIRLFCVLTAALLISIGAIVWILNIENVIRGSWSNIISVVFTFLGVIFALLQWHLQLSVGTQVAPLVLQSGIQHSSRQMESSDIKASEHKGALIVYTKRSLHGATVSLNIGFDAVNPKTHAASNVVEREEYGHAVYTSVFPLLEPGNYTAHVDSGQLAAKVTILAGYVAEIDWR